MVCYYRSTCEGVRLLATRIVSSLRCPHRMVERTDDWINLLHTPLDCSPMFEIATLLYLKQVRSWKVSCLPSSPQREFQPQRMSLISSVQVLWIRVRAELFTGEASHNMLACTIPQPQQSRQSRLQCLLEVWLLVEHLLPSE